MKNQKLKIFFSFWFMFLVFNFWFLVFPVYAWLDAEVDRCLISVYSPDFVSDTRLPSGSNEVYFELDLADTGADATGLDSFIVYRFLDEDKDGIHDSSEADTVVFDYRDCDGDTTYHKTHHWYRFPDNLNTQYVVTLEAYDIAGNFASDTCDFQINLLPEVTIDTPLNGASFADTQVTFRWTFDDDNNDTQSHYELHVGAGNWWSSADGWDSGEVVSSDTEVTYDTGLAAGTYYIHMRVKDDYEWSPWKETPSGHSFTITE